MELIREHWSKQDLIEFQKYLLTFSKGKEKGKWEQRIINTTLPCIAVPSTIKDKIVKEIAKGNFIEFINLWPWNNATETFIIGGLITKIKDFELQKKYLKEYSKRADNLDFAKELCNSKYTFSRRLGVIIMLKIVAQNNVCDILDFISIFENETEFYVNMAVSWLICECFVKFRNETLPFFENNNLSKQIINKAISKCRDSFRVSVEDKELLLKYKK